MDTYKDAVLLNDLWESGEPPWTRLERGARAMRALVTGGRGFAGSWLARALLESGCGGDARSIATATAPSGLELLGIAGDVDDVTGDLRDGDFVRSAACARTRIDAVFHLAAQPIVGDANASPVPTFETNIQGTWVLLEACREAGVERRRGRLLGQGLRAHTSELPYTEDSALQPIFPYDVSKAATDLIARSYWHTLRPAGRGDPASPTSTAAAIATSPA